MTSASVINLAIPRRTIRRSSSGLGERRAPRDGAARRAISGEEQCAFYLRRSRSPIRRFKRGEFAVLRHKIMREISAFFFFQMKDVCVSSSSDRTVAPYSLFLVSLDEFDLVVVPRNRSLASVAVPRRRCFPYRVAPPGMPCRIESLWRKLACEGPARTKPVLMPAGGWPRAALDAVALPAGSRLSGDLLAIPRLRVGGRP